MKTPPSDWMIVGSGRIVRKVLAMSQVKGSHDWEQIVGSSFLSYLKDSPPEFFACPTCSNEIWFNTISYLFSSNYIFQIWTYVWNPTIWQVREQKDWTQHFIMWTIASHRFRLIWPTAWRNDATPDPTTQRFIMLTIASHSFRLMRG